MVDNRPNTNRWADMCFFFGAILFVYFQTFQFPFTPIYHESDSLLTVSNAMRMLDGEVIYRYFFHLTPPGAELIYLTFFSLFGVRVWILSLVVVILSSTLIWLIWFLSRQVLTGVFVYLPSAIFLIVGFRLFGIDGSYRLFSIVFVLAAVAVLINKRTLSNLVVAGCLCGLASFFVQTRGVVGIAGICFFLLWENIVAGFSFQKLMKSGFALGLPFLMVISVSQAYFIFQAGFDNYYFCLITFPAQHYSHDPSNTYRAYLSDLPKFGDYLNIYSPGSAIFSFIKETGQKLFYYLLIPLIYIVLLVYLWLSRERHRFAAFKPQLMLLCSVGIFLAAGISAPTAPRIYHIAIPGLIILVWLLTQIPVSKPIALGLMSMFVVGGVAYSLQRQIVPKCYLNMPSGIAAFLSPAVCDKYSWIQQHIAPGESVYEGYHPSFYYPLHLINPTPLHMTRDSDYTPQSQVDAVVSSLKMNPPRYVIWPRKWIKPEGTRQPGDNLDNLWKHIRDNYQHVHTFSDIASTTDARENDMEVWEKKRTL